ncbi:UDP-N-acetylmuramate:L-alanyl-gamma-D-glutamyl-meso-diaminopimelate ligase [Echinimonas agarilytica]|uniref:UDP-N-acetylmuramate--L-alanyl-gamma-D-glutamyl-meso-2,6-diaminoheptandioate ligase n=1 Tax=Echinimonas agarilytica TaxID=1215918 RepID=A0AA41W4R6_9GAMM|nr:UDP-N-acetylmuramate:L-alanyl-gamma-D-glutamyl-meso-diaminopimelate ligase [Echinimonas agarilytica]MCM2678741.1 UDP-N-acetylmuramate:L-alanyl-gamma-D-glutamyl-meso-diaminopimelate ligase [Echinimonas agarilytica]
MHIHILGICGTFMGGVAALAKALGHQVTGSDANVYPPMSTQLTELGIELTQGYDPSQLDPKPDLVVIGNAMSRGNEAVEAVLDQGIPFMSGPEWLHRYLLQDRWVLAVSGTHGKTTTSSMLAWLLEYAGMKPGFLIGGIPQNFGLSARLGDSPFFVVEADEYDSAFFDKRSKFVHYHPRTLILNNLEFDHADIFDDLAAIERQFHHLVRIVPGSGRIIAPEDEPALQRVLEQGCWSEQESLGADASDWGYRLEQSDGSCFSVRHKSQWYGPVKWNLMGEHNVRNAVMAIAAARHVGVTPDVSTAGLVDYINTKRRMELRGNVAGVKVFDDFAHHPTAIATTIEGLRNHMTEGRLIAVLEPRSNTMKMGVHQQTLAASLQGADQVFLFQPSGLNWSTDELVSELNCSAHIADDIDALVQSITAMASPQDNILVMSNGGFGGIHEKILQALLERQQ